MFEDSRVIANPGDHKLQVWFEPWGDLLPLEPGGSFRLVGRSTEPGAFEVVEEEERFVVYAWTGATRRRGCGRAASSN